MRSRAQIDTVTMQADSQWKVSFILFAGEVGAEHKVGACASAAVFATEDEAYAGGNRALDVLEATGRFPNMCERF